MEILLDFNADVNARTIDGATPLHYFLKCVLDAARGAFSLSVSLANQEPLCSGCHTGQIPASGGRCILTCFEGSLPVALIPTAQQSTLLSLSFSRGSLVDSPLSVLSSGETGLHSVALKNKLQECQILLNEMNTNVNAQNECAYLLPLSTQVDR